MGGILDLLTQVLQSQLGRWVGTKYWVPRWLSQAWISSLLPKDAATSSAISCWSFRFAHRCPTTSLADLGRRQGSRCKDTGDGSDDGDPELEDHESTTCMGDTNNRCWASSSPPSAARAYDRARDEKTLLRDTCPSLADKARNAKKPPCKMKLG